MIYCKFSESQGLYGYHLYGTIRSPILSYDEFLGRFLQAGERSDRKFLGLFETRIMNKIIGCDRIRYDMYSDFYEIKE